MRAEPGEWVQCPGKETLERPLAPSTVRGDSEQAAAQETTCARHGLTAPCSRTSQPPELWQVHSVVCKPQRVGVW